MDIYTDHVAQDMAKTMAKAIAAKLGVNYLPLQPDAYAMEKGEIGLSDGSWPVNFGSNATLNYKPHITVFLNLGPSRVVQNGFIAKGFGESMAEAKKAIKRLREYHE